MLDEAQDYQMSAESQQVQETVEDPWQLLLQMMLEVVKSNRVTITTVVKLANKINRTILMKCPPSSREEWLATLSKLTSQAVDALHGIEFGTFTNMMTLWQPLISSIDKGASPVDEKLSEYLG